LIQGLRSSRKKITRVKAAIEGGDRLQNEGAPAINKLKDGLRDNFLTILLGSVVISFLAGYFISRQQEAKLRIGKMAQNENDLYNAAERGERSREPVQRGCVRKPLNDDIGRRGSVLERSRHTHQRVPLFAEQMGIRYAVKQRIEAFVISLAVHLIKVLIGQIAQPRSVRRYTEHDSR